MRAVLLCVLCAIGIVTACGGDDSGGDDGSSSGASGGGGGDGDGDGDGDGPQNDPDLADWTLFVYGHADHNLSNSFVRDVVEMAEADLTDNVQVIVLADFDASQEIAGTGERFPEGVEWLRVTGGEREPESIGTEGEFDLDDPDVLAQAVQTAFTEFPAERYALVLWDHGGAWNGGFGGDSQNGTQAGSPMSAKEVAAAVRTGLDGAGIDGPLDLFAFDTCLMAGAEVAFELREVAEVYIANAELDYGDGWDYKTFLSYLAEHSQEPTIALARREVRHWDAHHADASINDTLLRSHVAIATSGLPAFADAMAELVQSWLASETLTGIELARASYFSLPPYMNELADPQAEPQLRDVGQFLERMTTVSDATVAAAATAAVEALQATILERSQGELREAGNQLGLHVELPLASIATDELLAGYTQLASGWREASLWGDALATYRGLDDRREPTIASSITNHVAPDADNLPTIELSVADDDVAEIEVSLGMLDPNAPDDLILLGLVAKGAIDAGDSYQVPWNGQLAALPDGQGGAQAIFVRTWEDVGGDMETSLPPLLATFGLVDTPDGAQYMGALLFQDGDEETGVLSLLDPPVTLTLTTLASDFPGATFTPFLINASLSSGESEAVTGTPIPIQDATLPLIWGPAAEGTYALLISASDVYGNVGGDAQLAEITTPIAP